MAAKKKEKESPGYRELVTKVKNEGPDCLYVLYGEESYLIESFTALVRNACVDETSADFDAKRLEGPGVDLQELADAIGSFSFFGGRTYVELRAVDTNKLPERAQELLGDIPEWCTVLITLPPDTRPDGRLAMTKLLKKQGTVVEFAAQPETELKKWIRSHFHAHGKQAEPEAVERLMFLSGSLMTRLSQEIDKIAAYAQGDTVTVSDVDAVAHHIPEANVYEMTDAIAEGNMNKAASLMAELIAGGEEGYMLTAIIGDQIRQLYAARLALDRGLDTEFVKEVTKTKAGKKKPDFAVRNLMKSARRFTLEELRQDVRLCAEMDYRLKSESYTTGPELMAELLLRMAVNGKHAAR